MHHAILSEHLLGETVRYKKYLYVLRPLLAARWIRSGRGAPPMRFAELAQATLDDTALLAEINRLLEAKMRAGAAATSPRWAGIHTFILQELEAARAHQPAPSRRRSPEALDTFLRIAVCRHGGRQLAQASGGAASALPLHGKALRRLLRHARPDRHAMQAPAEAAGGSLH